MDRIKFSVRIGSTEQTGKFLLIEFLAASLTAIQGEKKRVQMRGNTSRCLECFDGCEDRRGVGRPCHNRLGYFR
jgi:hypothetical protein